MKQIRSQAQMVQGALLGRLYRWRRPGPALAWGKDPRCFDPDAVAGTIAKLDALGR